MRRLAGVVVESHQQLGDVRPSAQGEVLAAHRPVVGGIAKVVGLARHGTWYVDLGRDVVLVMRMGPAGECPR